MCIEHPVNAVTSTASKTFAQRERDTGTKDKHIARRDQTLKTKRPSSTCSKPNNNNKSNPSRSTTRNNSNTTTTNTTTPNTTTSSSTSTTSSSSICSSTTTTSTTSCASTDSSPSPSPSPTATTTTTTATTSPPVVKTTAILDWDDTICPSTHLASLGLRVDDAGQLPATLRAQLESLETAVVHIVEEALRFGNVVIITNAEAGWVELSGRRFLPRVVSLLSRHSIKIVSARTSFERHFPDAPSSWKMAAFSHEVDAMFPNEDELNVLVLGDSMSERDAAHALSSRLPNSKVKTVKFVERPSIDQLMRQVQLVTQSLPDLATYASSFDIDLVVSANA